MSGWFDVVSLRLLTTAFIEHVASHNKPCGERHHSLSFSSDALSASMCWLAVIWWAARFAVDLVAVVTVVVVEEVECS